MTLMRAPVSARLVVRRRVPWHRAVLRASFTASLAGVLAGALGSGWPGAVQAAGPRKPTAAPPGAAATPTEAASHLNWRLTGDAQLGAQKADSERCLECHSTAVTGSDRSLGTEGKFPKLDGQAPDYILKQIRDFRSGARNHDFMQIMARSVSDEDVADIAAYFHSLPLMKGDGRSGARPGEPVPGDAATGLRLYTQGDAARGIPACASCHGEGGRSQLQGQGPAAVRVPHIGGQEWRYLDKQLRDWRSGERRNSAGGVMSQVTRSLSDAEIESLANYLSGL